MPFNQRLKHTAACCALVSCLVGAASAPLPALASSTPAQAQARASAAPRATPPARSAGQGPISYYGPGFHGQRTANGERFDAQALTMAHRTLPFGSLVRVTNLRNGRSVVLRVNDRGPWARGRIADVSAAAAHRLGMRNQGVVRARLDVVSGAQAR